MLVAKVLQNLAHLLILREHPRRQQPSQLEPMPFLFGEGGALVERRVVQHVDAGRKQRPCMHGDHSALPVARDSITADEEAIDS